MGIILFKLFFLLFFVGQSILGDVYSNPLGGLSPSNHFSLELIHRFLSFVETKEELPF